MPLKKPSPEAFRRICLYGTLTILVALAFLYWRVDPNFGGNLLAESLGIFITVALVDRLIQWDEEARRKPARLAAFRDAMELSRHSREFVLALARSSVPFSDLDRVERETALSPSPWLASAMGQIVSTSRAPFGAPPPWGNGGVNWSVALDEQVRITKALLSRYLERHTAHGDPRLTEAIQDFEENGLFRSLSYGSELFWMMGPALREGMFKSFIEKLSRLVEILHEIWPIYFSGTDRVSSNGFDWARLAAELREHPTTHAHAEWRPAQ
jgi:hypothetical protein